MSAIASSALGLAANNGKRGTIISRISPNRIVATLGDSITAQNHDTPLTGLNSYAKGWMSQAHAFGRRAWTYGPEYNFGVAGDTTAGVLARTGATSLDALIALRPDRCAVEIGINDVNNGVARTTILANLRMIWDRLNDAGIAVDAMLITPRSDTTTDAAKRAATNWLNAKIIEEQTRRPPGLFGVLALSEAVTARDSSLQNPVSLYTVDGVHPIEYGAMLLGRRAAEYYNTIYPAVQASPVWSRSQTYDATNNPLGAINSYPIPTGTTGNLGAGASGVVPAGYTLYRSSGTVLTLAGAMTALTDPTGGYAFAVTLGASGVGGSSEVFRISNGSAFTIPATIPAGSKVRLIADIECIDVANVSNIRVNSVKCQGLAGSGATGDRVLANSRRIIETPAFVVVTPGVDTINAYIDGYCDCSGAGPSGMVVVRSLALLPEIAE